jgi:hypothetical protein
MALSSITSVLSRYFVVGFFMPAYVSLVVLWISASSTFVPNAIDHSHKQSTQLLILGGVALVAGLILSGLSYYIARAYEGYWLERLADLPVARRLYRRAITWQRRAYDRLMQVRENKTAPPEERARAAWRLDKWFPKQRDALLPTRLGNAIRAFERHSNARWGLDGVTVWPRIESLLSAVERELEVDAKINFYVFTNASVGSILVGLCLIVDAGANHAHRPWLWWIYTLPFLVAYVLYRAAIGPAVDWGDVVRSSIDLHRLDLYEKLGVRRPVSFSDEREVAMKVNKALLYAHPLLPDDLWRPATAESRRSDSTLAGGG